MVMQGEVQFPNDSWRLTLPKKFYKVAQKEFEARIQEILISGYTKLALDLSLVESTTPSGLSQIERTYLDLKAKGIQVTIEISPKIQGMLDRHGLSDLLSAAKL
jgi:anti-anti-sigma regulatory factor